jgi:hypothetical protein
VVRAHRRHFTDGDHPALLVLELAAALFRHLARVSVGLSGYGKEGFSEQVQCYATWATSGQRLELITRLLSRYHYTIYLSFFALGSGLSLELSRFDFLWKPALSFIILKTYSFYVWA